jgi:hypothetical protein
MAFSDMTDETGRVTVPAQFQRAFTTVVGPVREGAAALGSNLFLTQLAALGVRGKIELDPGMDAGRLETDLGRALSVADQWQAVQALAARMVKDGYRSTVALSAARSGLRWVRVPVGGACEFCRLMASEPITGPGSGWQQYFHDHCDCQVVVIDSAGAGLPRGSAQRMALWRREVNEARRAMAGTGGGALLAAMRQNSAVSYPSVAVGTAQPPFSPSERPMLSQALRRHVIDRHRAPHKWPGKTKFPVAWSEEKIFSSIDRVLKNPLTVEDYGQRFRFTAVVDGVEIRVIVRVDKPRPFIWTAYPVR